MLGLGWTEMLVIGVIALIFIGPKDLPVVMGRIGKVIGQVQRMGREFQREINRTTGLDEVRNLRTSITSPLKKTADEIRKDFNSMGKDGKESPSGALKPTDPKQESVVEAIQQQAGMTPAKKSADEMAADYGFTAKKAEPVKAPARASRAATAKGTAGKASTAKPAAAKAATVKSSTAKSARKPAARSSVATSAAAEAPASQPAKPAKPRAARSATATTKKPARKTPEKAADQAGKPAKPRATRKKTAETAGKTE
ncbi:MAG: Sec-independent protein translocase protein TatB [Devosia sp.]